MDSDIFLELKICCQPHHWIDKVTDSSVVELAMEIVRLQLLQLLWAAASDHYGVDVTMVVICLKMNIDFSCAMDMVVKISELNFGISTSSHSTSFSVHMKI